MDDPQYESNIMLNCPIAFDEVVKCINRLKCNKAVGIDCIPNEVLKQPGIHVIIYRLFNCIFNTNVMPSVWLKGIIHPIPKGSGKDPYVPLNYRGITLLSCLSKTYTSLLNNRILEYCDSLNLLVNEQNGFRKNRACIDHIFTLSSIIRNRLNSKLPTFCAFIDMQKAFDCVDRDLLLFSLLMFNIDGKVFKSIKSLYANTMSCVRLNNIMSGYFQTNSGVRQGDSLSPTLFAIYINGLASEIKSLNLGVNIDNQKFCILLYADDIVLISPDEYELQCMLTCMYEWGKKWKMNLNQEKFCSFSI
jgi:hypothetical protein